MVTKSRLARKAYVNIRRSPESTGRIEYAMKKKAAAAKNISAAGAWIGLRSIHQWFASKPGLSRSPKTFSSENEPRKNASPRATAGKNHECEALRLPAFSVFRRLSAKRQALFCAPMKYLSYSGWGLPHRQRLCPICELQVVEVEDSLPYFVFEGVYLVRIERVAQAGGVDDLAAALARRGGLVADNDGISLVLHMTLGASRFASDGRGLKSLVN